MDTIKTSPQKETNLATINLENVVNKLSEARIQLYMAIAMNDDLVYQFQRADNEHPITVNVDEVNQFSRIMQDLSKAFVQSGADVVAVSKLLLNSPNQSTREGATEAIKHVLSQNSGSDEKRMALWMLAYGAMPNEGNVAKFFEALGIKINENDIVEAEARIANKSESQLLEMAESYRSIALKGHGEVTSILKKLHDSKQALEESLEKKTLLRRVARKVMRY